MSASSSSNDLRNRIIFTIAILTVYRFGTFVPLPGIDPEQLKIRTEELAVEFLSSKKKTMVN